MLINCCSLLRTETLRHTSSSLRLCYSSRLGFPLISHANLMHVRMLGRGPVGGRGLAWPSFTVLQFSQPKNGQNHTCGASRRVCSAPTDIVTYPFLKTHASNPAFPTGLGLGLERFGFCSGGVERRDSPRPFYRRYYKIIAYRAVVPLSPVLGSIGCLLGRGAARVVAGPDVATRAVS